MTDYSSIRARSVESRLAQRSDASARSQLAGKGNGRPGYVFAIELLDHIDPIAIPDANPVDWEAFFAHWLSGPDDEAPGAVPPILLERAPDDSWQLAGGGTARVLEDVGYVTHPFAQSANILLGARAAGMTHVLVCDVNRDDFPDTSDPLPIIE